MRYCIKHCSKSGTSGAEGARDTSWREKRRRARSRDSSLNWELDFELVAVVPRRYYIEHAPFWLIPIRNTARCCMLMRFTQKLIFLPTFFFFSFFVSIHLKNTVREGELSDLLVMCEGMQQFPLLCTQCIIYRSLKYLTHKISKLPNQVLP
jgi:hypothetical protein